MFYWLKKFFKGRKSSTIPATSSGRIASVSDRRPVQQYTYPPVAAGIPRFPITEILGEHEELIQQLRSLSEHKEVFDARYFPVITRYAEYVYLLPASEAHHHRGPGGLLRHGLECAKYALQQAYERVHRIEMSPQKRKAARERWLFGCFTSALCHDMGKPASDMLVYSMSGRIWGPFIKPLVEWYHALPPEDEVIYISWRKEGQDHRRMALYLLNHVLLSGDLSYLYEIEPILLDHMHQAILGQKGIRNTLTDMVQEADKKSVSQDLKNSHVLSDLGPEVSQPLARHFMLAMKRLVTEGQWRPNESGSVLWVIGLGVFMVWPEMAGDIVNMLRSDGTPAPIDPMVLADILEDHGLLELAPNGNRLWRIWPSVVDAMVGGLLALRLKDPRYVMDLVPPAVPGEVRGEGEEGPEPLTARRQGHPESESPPGYFNDPLLLPPGILLEQEPECFQDPQTLEELKDYFAEGGLGGQTLLKFAKEIYQGTRQEGVDYITGPTLLLCWGGRKFTNEVNLPEVIESLARVEWLVLNGNRRVHEDSEFGRCLRLREQETTLFWQLVGRLEEAMFIEPGAEVSLEDTLSMVNAPLLSREARPSEALAGDSPRFPASPEEEGELVKTVPKWVSEVMVMLDRDGSVDYETVKKMLTAHRARKQILKLVCKYFIVGNEGGRMVILHRLP